MPEQEQQQPDGAEFHVENEFESGDEQAVAPEASNETQPDSNLEDEGRYDEQKAATIGAAVLEYDERANKPWNEKNTNDYKQRLTDLDEEIEKVKGGGESQTIFRSHERDEVINPLTGREESFYEVRTKPYDAERSVEEAEERLAKSTLENEEYHVRKAAEYDEYVQERTEEKEDAIASGSYENDKEYYDNIPSFAEYLEQNSYYFYPKGIYEDIGELERKKTRLEELKNNRSELMQGKLREIRSEEEARMQRYLSEQSDYYAELYDMNPELFASMPTKEFMEHRDELAGLEQTRAEQKRYEQGLAGVVDTLGKVLKEAADYEKSVKVGEYGDTRDGHRLWFDHQFLRNDYRVASMMNVFHGYGYELSDIFRLNGSSYGNRSEHMDGYVWDMMHEAKANNGNGYNFVDITPVERRLWEETGAYFDDYTKKRLDVTPRQLIEGFSAVFDKYRAEAQTKLDEVNEKIDEFKQRFAPKQEEQTDNGPENS